MTDKTITLASIREDIEEKYGHTPIDIGTGNPVLLINPTRLSEAQRQGLRQYQDRMQALTDAAGEKEGEEASEASEEDLKEQVSLMRSLLETVAESPAAAGRLLKAIDGLPEGDRILAIAAVVERYMGQQGEASPSES